ncbi:MAG TPA: MBL fold metallo-hydrolase [Solirubrobacteraceae bacterium]|nr:MBL fold metallo-hydrolase [Solirubrobacteraceae bacterium]
MRAVALHGDVLVCWSRVWQTSCTAVRAGKEALVIDSPVYPDELELLPVLVERAGFGVEGLLATHADWDHLLGRAAFPRAPLGCAETTAARLAVEPGRPQRELRDFDQRHYVERARPLSLPAAQPLPVPGYCEVGDSELELHAADGHTSDGMAVWIPWSGTLVCGDYLSPVEVPVISAGGSLDGYRATLARLRPLVQRAEAVVPGHGPVLDRERALDVLAQDEAYLEDLARRGADAALPPGRSGSEQRRLHAVNADRLA